MKNKVKRNIKIIPLLLNIIIPLLGGLIVGYINRNSMDTYRNLKKFVFTPPDIVFAVVWIILYILMGIAAYRIYVKNKSNIDDKGAYFFYIIQLILNFMWSFIFFTFRLYGISFLWIIMLFVFVIITFIKFIKIDKIAGLLLIPYMIWLVYAGFLNFFIWVFNEM
ncbi:TspO/MBR family protein [Clostridium nigeriense]|uniref:TspO/MBR family protein n=1 Tax=Clostridium nigeriense TaxID=1805470 RepID=UPI0008303C8B|nr:TspO/MBR family protein [Clostridium nigeriense]